MKRLWLVFLIVSALLAAALVWRERVLRAEIESLRAAIKQQPAEQVPHPGEPPRTTPVAPAPSVESPGRTPAVDPPAVTAGIAEWRDKLDRASETITRLESRIAELETGIATATEENHKANAAQTRLEEDLAANKRLVDALQAELKTRTERATEAAAANRIAAEELRAVREQLKRATQPNKELDEINRRREMYLTNILRRYRELAEQYRLMAQRLDSGDLAPARAPGELSRIESTVSMAEEDLRQLTNLNAQAARLGKR
jgi:chromosome segregation ATPase